VEPFMNTGDRYTGRKMFNRDIDLCSRETDDLSRVTGVRHTGHIGNKKNTLMRSC
jgi:hypothetical protein